MKALDTNILLRYLVQDDAAQARIANAYIQKHCTRDYPAFINRIVLCELVWVLESFYAYGKKDIIHVLEKILQTSQFLIENIEAAWQALDQYKKSNVDYADALLGKINRSVGCRVTATFDKKAGKLREFEVITS